MSPRKYPKKWTKLQIECYNRNCICEGCVYKERYRFCHVKYSLIEQIKACGRDKKVTSKTIIE